LFAKTLQGFFIMVNFPSAVIFDMDGTLVASTELDFLAWQKLFKEYGVNISFQQYYPLIGMKSADMVSHFLKLEGLKANYALTKKMEYFDELLNLNGIKVFPNAENLLNYFREKSIPLALATSSRKRKMRRVMLDTGFEQYFKVFITGEDVENGKPKPDMFLLAAQRLSVLPAKCLVFEDAISGVHAAKAAGMKCVAITNTHPENDLSMADLIINDFGQISETVISNLFS
jgi:beta-phosphoglucomutase family hydrolase